MSDIELDYRVPGPDVADYATLFYFFRTDLGAFEDMERADHAQMRFRLDDGAAEYQFPDGTVQQATPIHVIGPTSAAFRVRADGPVR
ncbi:MAG: AraC family transcriptional regulator, partial [Proteobacteria bacterium]|nr:AraC family transcriptional regulator [Pseudomonadota bacterium]